ncbi:inorganic phosphate transporter [Halegenticoccus soli]|uniref:inorganic phosphate transporter n=1 Tax=Halegenticoccus soli TaxID=1985678 RepID=UPI000C6EB771|nr:inorganic phosphate transporter [Halegenticoccus soli]
MNEILLAVGLGVAVFVGFNIGGSNTGVAFGPAVGSGAVSKLGAGVLMSGFALLGGWTVGRRVVDTLGSELVSGDPFTLAATIAVLFFIGAALFVSNVFGVPASTSMTAVGAIAGLGLATGRLNTGVIMEIVSWWLVSPVIGFWVSAVVGRYGYDWLAERIAVSRSEGPLVEFDPLPRLGPETTPREFGGTLLVIGIACYMGFSAGASNVANAVAPLVGNGAVTMNQGILLAAGAMGLGAFTIARRTLETMGNDLTELPLVAALVIATVSASLVTVLSALGIPASFVVIATMSIVGLGWGRATIAEDPFDPLDADSAADAEIAATPIEETGTDEAEPQTAAELYRPATTARVIVLQNLVPVIATVVAYLVFRYTPPA